MRTLRAFILAVVLLANASIAEAVEFKDTNVEIRDPAYVTGELWVDSSAAYSVVIRERQCWYPQEWYADVVILDESGEITGYNTNSPYYELVHIDLEDDASRFGPIAAYSSYSCIQDVFFTRGDCSDEERLAVLSTAAVRDVYRGVTLAEGDFDTHDIGGLYCLVLITRDSLYDRLDDEEHVPEPVRATFPQTRTLVGLENSVWYDVADGIDATDGGFGLDIPTAGADYSLNLSIWLAGVEIDVDSDGYPEFSTSCEDPATCTGSLENPLFTFQYETRAFHNFTIRTLWTGLAIDDIGTVLQIEPGMMGNELAFDWETVEVRSSLDG